MSEDVRNNWDYIPPTNFVLSGLLLALIIGVGGLFICFGIIIAKLVGVLW